MNRSRQAFTLLEVLIVILVLGMLAFLALSHFRGSVDHAQEAEAITTVGVIVKNEEFKKLDNGAYVAANNTEEVNARLALDIRSKDFDYRVVNVTDENFIVIASRIKNDLSGAVPRIVLAMDRAGAVPHYVPPAPVGGEGGFDSGGGSGGGGYTGGGSSGSGGGGAGAGGGGSAGGGGYSGGGEGESHEGFILDPLIYDSSLQACLDLLNNSTAGKFAYDLIMDKGIRVIYDDFSKYEGAENAAAFWWGTGNNTIYVRDSLQVTSCEPAIAAMIVHEATHADYDYYPDKWIASTLAEHPDADPISIPGDSIDQEYHCFVNQCETWKELRGDFSDINCDGWLEVYEGGGEEFFKSYIQTAYTDQDLPEY